MQIRDRIQSLQRIKARDLVVNEQNWREHPPEQQTAMQQMLAEIGYVGALLVRPLSDGRFKLIDGHLRASTTPDMEVPCLVVDITEEEAAKVLATFDPLSAMAVQNSEALAGLIQQIGKDDPLLNFVWPDYVLDPLTTANWEPPAQEEMPAGHAGGHKLALSDEQHATIQSALEQFRKLYESGDDTDGAVLAKICETT